MMTSSHVDPVASQNPTPVPEPSSVIRVSVAVVEEQPSTLERMLGMLGDGVTPFATIDELAARLTGTVPVVVVLGPSCANETVLASAEQMMAKYPMLATVLVVEELTTTLLQQALRAGVRDVLALSGEPGALGQAVQRLAVTLDQAPRAGARSRWSAPRAAGADGRGATSPIETVNGQVITVFSTKGGAGKSVIADQPRRARSPSAATSRSCLVDADLQFGDVAVMLKLAPQHTIVDAVGVARPARRRRCSQSLLVTPRAVGPAGPAGPARAGLRRPDRRRRDGRDRRDAAHVLPLRRRRHAGVLQRRRARPHRGQRRRPARRRHGHPEHQEREDRPADAAAAEHADGEAAAGPQPGQLAR